MAKEKSPMAAKTLQTLTAEDWKDLAGLVKTAAELIDEEDYPKEYKQLERCRALLTHLKHEWDEIKLQETIVR